VNHETLFNKLLTDDETFINKSIKTKNLNLNLSKARIPTQTYIMFNSLTKEINLIKKFKSFFSKNTHNISEKISVNHHQLRSNKSNFYTKEKNRLIKFINTIHKKNIITDIVQIGIGGSYIGPKSIHEALTFQTIKTTNKTKLNGHFITSLDPLEFKTYVQPLNPKTTLFILASKSGHTQEIIANLNLLKEWWKTHQLPLKTLPKHCISLTTKGSPIDKPEISENRFYIDKTIGGRFSTTSVIGLCIIGLCFGVKTIEEFLSGAANMDKNATNPTCDTNLSLAAAWEHIWQHTIKKSSSRAIIPYSFALQTFPLFIQQLICESNGKSVNHHANTISYKTAPIIVTGTGTNAQHSFFQLLHQGTDIIPVEFIGIKDNNNYNNQSENQAKKLLNANMYAQIEALQLGQSAKNKHYILKGKKPSSLLLLNDISPYTMGQLIAYYENKTIFEGLIWNINSFDQLGVELGKKLIPKFISQ